MATVKELDVLRGKTLNWRITKPEYQTIEGSMVIINDDPIEIEMRPEGTEIDVSDYEYTLENKELTLTKYIGTNPTVKIPNV